MNVKSTPSTSSAIHNNTKTTISDSQTLTSSPHTTYRSLPMNAPSSQTMNAPSSQHFTHVSGKLGLPPTIPSSLHTQHSTPDRTEPPGATSKEVSSLVSPFL